MREVEYILNGEQPGSVLVMLPRILELRGVGPTATMPRVVNGGAYHNQLVGLDQGVAGLIPAVPGIVSTALRSAAGRNGH